MLRLDPQATAIIATTCARQRWNPLALGAWSRGR